MAKSLNDISFSNQHLQMPDVSFSIQQFIVYFMK